MGESMDQRKHAAWLTAARYCPPINANFRAVGSEANPGIFFRDAGAALEDHGLHKKKNTDPPITLAPISSKKKY